MRRSKTAFSLLLSRLKRKDFLDKIVTGGFFTIIQIDKNRRLILVNHQFRLRNPIFMHIVGYERYDILKQGVWDLLEASRPVILLLDNTRPHIANVIKQAVYLLRWLILPHPAYFLDLTPVWFLCILALSILPDTSEIYKSISDVINSKPCPFTWLDSCPKIDKNI